MRLQKLDKIKEGEAFCYLCKVELAEYIRNIPSDYRDFDVQRGIVNNKYLDHLVDTIADKKHIPPIVLVAESVSDNGDEIIIPDFRILDGLQRTHRLKVIHDSISLLIGSESKSEIELNPAKFSRQNNKKIKDIGSNTKLIKALVDNKCHFLNEPDDFFEGNTIWLEVWAGLDDGEQIKKMLLLNAGHKAVNIKHQLEVLFLGTLVELEGFAPSGVKFIREKEQSAIQYSKTRSLGKYHFSHIVSSLIALSAGKVVNTNSDFVSNIQADSVKDIDLVEGFDLSLLKIFVSFLHNIDKELSDKYGDRGVKWIGREVVLIGMFGAIGAYAKDNCMEIHEALIKIDKESKSIVDKIDLDAFEEERNKVELNKVNVGNINKKAVFKAVSDIVANREMAGWSVYFGGAGK